MSRDLILLALSLLTWGLGEGMFLFFQPLYLQRLGADPVSIGAILGGWGLAMTVAHVPAGYLADRFGRRPLLWAAWLMGTFAALLMALANSLPMFAISLMAYGVTSFVVAPMNSYVTSARGKLSVGRSVTLISAAFNTGAILGPWLGGQIGDRFSLRTIYWVAAAIFFLSTLIILFIRPQPVELRPEGKRQNGLGLNRMYTGYLLVVFLAMFATYLPQPFSSNFLQNQRFLSFPEIGQLGSISSIGVVVLSLILGQLNARLGFLLGQIAVGLFALALWRGDGILWYALGYLMLGGYRTARVLATAQTRELVHPSYMGLAYGLTEATSATAMILAPLLAGLLYDSNPSWIYSTSLIFIVLSVLASVSFFLFRKKTENAFATQNELAEKAVP